MLLNSLKSKKGITKKKSTKSHKRNTRRKTHGDFNVFVQVLAGSCKLLRSGVLEVPKFVFHPAVEFLRVLLPLEVELDTDGGVL
jgi:hypothetical protein